MPARLAVVSSHPIQYLGPLYSKMAVHPRIDLKVFFCSDHGQRPTFDRGFNATFAWQRPITDGYEHEYLRSMHPRPGPYGFWSLTNPDLWTRLRRERFDAVLLAGWGYASCFVALAAARAHGVKVLLRSESGPESWPPRPLWRRTSRRLLLTTLFREVDAFLAIGSYNAELYRRFGVSNERIFLSPYAVDNDYFLGQAAALAPRRKELRARLGVLDDRPLVIASGKLVPVKAPLDILRAFARARQRVPAKLAYLGDGPLRAEIERCCAIEGIADDVVVTGFRQQEELGEIYAAADLLAFASMRETWGLVVNEAMLFGLPVLCSDGVGAHRDLVEPGVTGDKYPAGDVERLAALLSQWLNSPGQLRQMGERAQARVRDWSLERAVEGAVQAVDYVLGSQAGRGRYTSVAVDHEGGR